MLTRQKFLEELKRMQGEALKQAEPLALPAADINQEANPEPSTDVD